MGLAMLNVVFTVIKHASTAASDHLDHIRKNDCQCHGCQRINSPPADMRIICIQS